MIGEQNGAFSWRFWPVLFCLLVIATISFQRLGIILFTAPGHWVNYYLESFLSLAGLFLISTGFLMSWSRLGLPWLVFDKGWIWLCVGVVIGFAILKVFSNISASVVALILFKSIVFFFVIYLIEKSSGAIGAVVALTFGIMSILFILPCFMALEIAYHANLINEYLGLPQGTHGWVVSVNLVVSMVVTSIVGVDALAGIYFTGRMLTPFKGDAQLRILSYAVMVSQARLLNELVLAWKGFVLNASWPGWLLLMGTVIAIHWGISRLQHSQLATEEG